MELTQEKLYKDFPITSVCRADLQEYFTKEEIALFDDNQMEHLASKMADAYLDNGYWIDLKVIGNHILEDLKEEEGDN